jgi:hypothetical protein
MAFLQPLVLKGACIHHIFPFLPAIIIHIFSFSIYLGCHSIFQFLFDVFRIIIQFFCSFKRLKSYAYVFISNNKFF